MPLVKRMRKGDLFSMRISACFLYAYIYKRLDAERRAYVRLKFAKLCKDDTPMVRRGAAQSISILSDHLEAEYAKEFLLPLLKGLLADDNDSVKINAVYSSTTVGKLLGDPDAIKQDIISSFSSSVDNKVSWRLRFAVAEVAAQLAEYTNKDIADQDIVTIYE